MAGDHPDPSILKDGDDYYMTFSSFDAYPGLVHLALARSRQLAADRTGAVQERRLGVGAGSRQAQGPLLHLLPGHLAEPIELRDLGRQHSRTVERADRSEADERIDPGHAVGPDGRRYLFLSAGELVPLADDGLSTVGAPKKVYDGWKYPGRLGRRGLRAGRSEDPSPRRLLLHGARRGRHGRTADRSHDRRGAIEDRSTARGRTRPYNPIVRTQVGDERWWSKGHGTLVEDRAGKWFMVYHAYENGYYTLGRQTLLEPIEWTADGWFRARGANPAAPIAKPAGERGPAWLRLLGRFLDAADGRAVELLRGRRRRSRSLSLRERRAGPEGQGHAAPPTVRRSGS